MAKESIYHSGDGIGMLVSKMAANMAAKTQKYVYFRSEVSYNYSSSVEYNIFKVKESIYRSGNTINRFIDLENIIFDTGTVIVAYLWPEIYIFLCVGSHIGRHLE